MLVHERAYDEREVHFDFAVRGRDGGVVCVVDDFVWRSFAAIDPGAIEWRHGDQLAPTDRNRA